jgi:hypothetical protein
MKRRYFDLPRMTLEQARHEGLTLLFNHRGLRIKPPVERQNGPELATDRQTMALRALGEGEWKDEPPSAA